MLFPRLKFCVTQEIKAARLKAAETHRERKT